MIRTIISCLVVTIAIAFCGGIASAQSGHHGFITVSGGIHTGGQSLSIHREFEVNQESASYDATHPFASGVLVDGGVGFRIWKDLGAGVSVSRFTSSTPATVEARIPHPFQFGSLREFNGESFGAERTETGVHVQMLYHLPLTGRLRAVVFGGPSYLMTAQELVSAVHYDESYPYDTATFRSADVARATGSALGLNAGVDAFWMFTKMFGTGGLVRFTRASIDLDAPAGQRVAFDAGGVHAAAGLRFFF